LELVVDQDDVYQPWRFDSQHLGGLLLAIQILESQTKYLANSANPHLATNCEHHVVKA
jgi:hypothetical protein